MEHLYFYEDEVFRLNKKGNLELGMVLQNAEHASSDEEDEEYSGVVKNGYVRVAWHPSGVEQVLQEKKVGLADRSLMPGDVVRRLIKGKDTQRGYCRSINVKSDLQVLGSNQVILNVNSNNLSPVENFLPGIVVVLRSWVGTVKTVSSVLHLTMPDGLPCVIGDVAADLFEDLEERRRESEFPHRSDYHPGQVLVSTYQDVLSADWIAPPKDLKPKSSYPKIIKMMVQEVITKSVTVHWQCCAYADKQQQPNNIVEGDDLKLLLPLNVFESCTLQIGDRSFHHFQPADTVLTKEAWRYRQEWALFARKSHWKRDKPKRTSDTGDESKTPEPDVDPKLLSAEGWETDEGDSVSVSSGCSSNSSAGGGVRKKKTTTGLMTKMLKLKKLRRTRRRPPNLALKPDTRYVVETLMTSSNADVVWQDGTVEMGIASTDLYPIHHLDDQEFFPGDFVVENKDTGCLRLYGVVQSVDHVGRLATVTWFHTYTTQQEAQPKRLETAEVSVYDLKDHPDFQYRPGTVALRIAGAGAEPEKEVAAVGQVLDNYPEGRVHMWWVDGKTSMCWPQDLYKVGDYDSDEGELWDDNASEGSWETESEEELDETDIKPLLTTHIEKARVSMSKLEDLFTHNPTLQSVAVMQRLLEVYRDCRYLDKLMGSSFFHENNFKGLLKQVRGISKSTAVGQRVSDQVMRLSGPQCSTNSCTQSPVEGSQEQFEEAFEKFQKLEISKSTKDAAGTETVANNVNTTETPIECSNSPDVANAACQSQLKCPDLNNSSNKEPTSLGSRSPDPVSLGEKSPSLSDRSPNGVSHEGDKSPNSVNSGPLMQSSSQDDSGVFEHSVVSADASSSENCDCIATDVSAEPRKQGTYVFGATGSRVSYGSSEKRVPRLSITKHTATAGPLSAGVTGVETPSETNPCAQLCSLIKIQLCLACYEVSLRLNGDMRPMRAPAESAPTEPTQEEAPPTPGPEEVEPIPCAEGEGFEVVAAAPPSHKFHLGLPATPDKTYLKTVAKELTLLRNALPAGIWVKGYEERMDLYSIMIRGPEKTPYEDGLFLFDAQLPRDYPHAPPILHYHSYCADRLNPNLYEDGKVCVSLLGTWKGRGTEMWTPNSTLLQVIVSIQGLILVKEPYYNEAGYEKQKGSQQGHENSRMYNEMAILKLVHSMTKLSHFPHAEFQREIKQHFAQNAVRLVERLEKWLDISEKYNQMTPPVAGAQCQEVDAQARNKQWQQSALNVESAGEQPDFPLLPASRGFCITMRKTLEGFRAAIAS